MQSARAYDVAIVGAGPAGSACAIRLLQDSSDLRIVIIDRDAMPRPKSCGDLISPVTQMRLRPLGIDVADAWAADEHIIAAPSGIEDRVRGLPESPWQQCRVIERRDFDLALLDRARSLGASALEGHRFIGAKGIPAGWHVQLRGPGADPVTLAARVLIGADGATSSVARAIGCPGSPAGEAVALRGYAVLTRDSKPWSGTRMDFLPWLLPAYGWAFSVDATGRTNIGVGRSVREARAGEQSLHELLADYLEHLQRLGFKASPVGEVTGARLAITAREHVTSRRAALIGDAAGLVSPVDGEGISMALASGIRLARSLAAAHPEDDASIDHALTAYTDWCHRLARPHLARGARISAWLANPVIAERVLKHDGCAQYARLASGRMDPLREAIAAG